MRTSLPSVVGEVPALAVRDLDVRFPHEGGLLHAASDVGFRLEQGSTLGIVGESGCGKSVTLRSLCGLIPAPGVVTRGEIEVQGVTHDAGSDLSSLRGSTISMIFQDPSSSLNPVHTVGAQLAEVLRVKLGHSRRAANVEAVELLDHVGIPDPAERMAAYPHELSGGLRQRVMIAMAIAPRPQILLADEPTTALDVTTQERVLQLLMRLQRESGMGIVLVSHDLGVISEICDEVIVMYAGYVVERGLISEVMANPRHPYTEGLTKAMPRIDSIERPQALAGQPPDLSRLPPGCPFEPRCRYATAECRGVEMAAATRTGCACPFEAARQGAGDEVRLGSGRGLGAR